MKNILYYAFGFVAAIVVLVWLLFDGEARREYNQECDSNNEIY